MIFCSLAITKIQLFIEKLLFLPFYLGWETLVRYNLLVKGHKENGINIGIPKTLWEKAMGLFGIKVTKKQIVSEAICYFLDNEYSI